MLRAIGYLWSLPLSLFGWLTTVVGRAELQHAFEGCAVYRAKEGGLCDRFFERFGMAAYTWGAVIVVASSDWKPAGPFWTKLLRHERRHFVQACRWGLLFPFAYGIASLVALAKKREAYRDNAFEVDARAHEDEPTL